ncbi:excisionase [Stutzerimonas balearica]|uniref:excisionase n=1 Tax=Stutzerimonas balearica TaxID=74829 RepID=UPI0028AE972A|nr:excisionase [Stutzerimonas balearica]
MALLTLEEWAKQTYETPPTLNTLRRWARDGFIYPAPEKHGRSYFVSPSARYIEPRTRFRPDGSLTLVERLAIARASEKQASSKRRPAGN